MKAGDVQYNHLISAILRGTWLLEKQWADAHMPLVARMMKGESVNIGQPLKTEEAITTVAQISAVGYRVSYYTDLNLLPQNSIALVDLRGPITRYGGACSYGLEDKAALLRRLYSAGNIAGIVLCADTPGGEASGTGMFAELVRKRNKPVYGHIEDGIAASAGMWIMSQCDGLYVSNERCAVGSIGAYTTIADWYAYFEEEGLKVRDIYAPQSTDKNKDYRAALKGDDTLIENNLFDLVESFKADVTQGRKGKIKANGEEPFTGKMYNAKQAKKLGLIDGVASLEDVIDMASAAAKKSKTTTSNLNNNAMATNKNRPNLAKAAGLDEGATADEQGNITLSEDQADTVETALALAGEHATTAATKAAEAERLTAELNAMTMARDQAITERDAARAEAAQYGAEQANRGTALVIAEETTEATANAQPKKLDPVTQKALEYYNRNNRNS